MPFDYMRGTFANPLPDPAPLTLAGLRAMREEIERCKPCGPVVKRFQQSPLLPILSHDPDKGDLHGFLDPQSGIYFCSAELFEKLKALIPEVVGG